MCEWRIPTACGAIVQRTCNLMQACEHAKTGALPAGQHGARAPPALVATVRPPGHSHNSHKNEEWAGPRLYLYVVIVTRAIAIGMSLLSFHDDI